MSLICIKAQQSRTVKNIFYQILQGTVFFFCFTVIASANRGIFVCLCKIAKVFRRMFQSVIFCCGNSNVNVVQENFVFKGLCMFLLFMCIALAGCADPKIAINQDTIYEPPMLEVENEYLLGPGDVIEIIYHYTPKLAKTAYHLAVGDVINVEFQYHSYMTRKLIVNILGKIVSKFVVMKII